MEEGLLPGRAGVGAVRHGSPFQNSARHLGCHRPVRLPTVALGTHWCCGLIARHEFAPDVPLPRPAGHVRFCRLCCCTDCRFLPGSRLAWNSFGAVTISGRVLAAAVEVWVLQRWLLNMLRKDAAALDSRQK